MGLNQNLLTKLLTPDVIPPTCKLKYRGEVYGVGFNSFEPLIKIGRGYESIPRVSQWIKTYPEEWSEKSIYIFQVKKLNTKNSESQLHSILNRNRLGKNEFAWLIRLHLGKSPDLYTLDGRTEWFRVDEELNEVLTEITGINYLEWWYNQTPPESEINTRHHLLPREDLEEEVSIDYLIEDITDLEPHIVKIWNAQWESSHSTSADRDDYKRGLNKFFTEIQGESIPSYLERYQTRKKTDPNLPLLLDDPEYKEFFDLCNELNGIKVLKPALTVNVIPTPVEYVDLSQSTEVVKKPEIVQVKRPEEEYQEYEPVEEVQIGIGEFCEKLKNKTEIIPVKVMVGALSIPLLYKVTKEVPIGSIIPIVVVVIIFWRMVKSVKTK
jgi:hypothetical protein